MFGCIHHLIRLFYLFIIITFCLYTIIWFHVKQAITIYTPLCGFKQLFLSDDNNNNNDNTKKDYQIKTRLERSEKNDTNKYLGILEADTIKQVQMKDKV